MATFTTNYNFEKPAGTDYYDVGVFNANMDKVDAALNGKANGQHEHDISAVNGLQAALDGKATVRILTVTIPTDGWTAGTKQYTITLSVPGMLSTDTPICDCVLSTDAATRESQIKNFGRIELVDTGADSVTLYAASIPGEVLTMRMEVIR